jgi:aminoglycoside phosphotransferase (APT) family kinase protein
MLSLADRQLVAREPAMPGLATLLDAEAFVVFLRTACPQVEIRSGQPTYVRYKPRTNCLVTYRLQLASAETLVYAIAHDVNAQAKLEKAERWRAVGSALGPGYLVCKELALVIYSFPNDRKLKALRRLADPAARQRLFQHLLPQWPELWASNVIPLRYKPERRYVARLQAHDRQALLKFYADHDYANAYVSARAFTSDQHLCIARPLGRSHRHQVQALQWLYGQPLEEALRAAQDEPIILHQVARALAALHSQKPMGLMHYTPQAEAATVQAAAAAVVAICPQGDTRTNDLARRLTAQFERSNVVMYAIHNDFSADQMLLLDDGRVGLLDLDNAGTGDPMADLGAFAAQLYQDALCGLLPLARADEVVNKLLHAYRLAAPHAWDVSRFHMHTAARLLRLAPEPFRKREPDWVKSVKATLQLAEEISNYGRACC